MLGHLQTHQEYLSLSQSLWQTIPDEFKVKHELEWALFQRLDFDVIHDIIRPLYAKTGRPSHYQIECLRALILSVQSRISFCQMTKELKRNPVLRAIVAIPSIEEVPAVGTFYTLMKRLCPFECRIPLDDLPKKTKVKQKKNQKQKNKRKDIVKKIVAIAKRKELCPKRAERLIQQIFHKLAIQSSRALGLLSDDLIVSGDGTPIPIAARSYLHKQCACRDKADCACTGHLSDGLARWGWDSCQGQWFFGHSAYLLSTYNEEYRLDLPLHFRLMQAQRHDAVACVFSLDEFHRINPNFKIKYFLADSAHDADAIYDWCQHLKITPVIPLNSKNTGKTLTNKIDIQLSDEGIPICAGLEMTYAGSCPGRKRHKWRCTICAKKLHDQYPDHYCSDSSYGRVYYTKFSTDSRLFPVISRKSNLWRKIYRQRTATERINKQIMIDYDLEHSRVRGRTSVYFMMLGACVLIHLKAQHKYCLSESAS